MKGKIIKPFNILNDEIQSKLKCFFQWVSQWESVIIAFSGGVDSTVLAKLCSLSPDIKKSQLVSAKNEFLSSFDLSNIHHMANELNLPFVLLEITVLDNELIRKNPKNRCYYCKYFIYKTIQEWSHNRGFQVIFDGTNMDDLTEDRPGHKAINELNIKQPFIEVALNKSELRQIASVLNLSNANRPSTTCLATRIPFNTPIQLNSLNLIDQIENILWSYSLRQVRARLHGNTIRIEVALEDFPIIIQKKLREQLIQIGNAFNIKHITLDLEGYKQGGV